MNGYCYYGNMKGSEARAKCVVTELPDGEHIRCECGRKLKKSSAGYGAGWTIPRHKSPKKES